MVRAPAPQPPRKPKGWGSVVRKVNTRGAVTYKPKLVVAGVTYWGQGVSVKRIPGMSVEQCDRRAKAEAEQFRKVLVRSVESNTHQEADQRRAGLGDVLKEWAREVDGSSRAATTKARYRELLTVLEPHVGTTLPARLALLRPPHVRALHQALRDAGRATSTVLFVHNLLLAALRWAGRQGLPVYGPLIAPRGAVEKPGHVAKEKRSVSVAEVNRLLDAMKDDYPFGPLVAVLYYQGLRDAEASGLKWGDIGPTGIDVKRQRGRRSRVEAGPKWGSSGWVPMLPQAKEWLDRQRAWCQQSGYPTDADAWVFGHKSNARAQVRPPLYDTTWAHIKAACVRAKLSADISAHSLRHGFADAANEAGVGVRDLAELIRNNPAVALRYQHRDVARLRAAAGKISAVMASGDK